MLLMSLSDAVWWYEQPWVYKNSNKADKFFELMPEHKFFKDDYYTVMYLPFIFKNRSIYLSSSYL